MFGINIASIFCCTKNLDGTFIVYYLREIDENALEQALSAAITCTILAGAGPQRSRVLATLYKVLALCSSQYPMFSHLYLPYCS
jgi:hypothetical protein